MTTATSVVIRPRRPADLPRLVEVLGHQQPSSHYPLVWPLPQPPESFIARVDELGSWVAEVDGVIVGHVCVTPVRDDTTGQVWATGSGLSIGEMGCVSSLFVDVEVMGSGIGGRLLDTAVAFIRARGLTPVLDVTKSISRAASVYQRRGWNLIGTGRPDWLPDDQPDVEFYLLPDDVGQQTYAGSVVSGHGVASGRAPESPYAGGTIALQTPFFNERGLDLTSMRPATVNVRLAGDSVSVPRPSVTLTDVVWTNQHGAETFSFVFCTAEIGGAEHGGLIYYPHPDTKPAHFQPAAVVELLLPDLGTVTPGDQVSITVPTGALELTL